MTAAGDRPKKRTGNSSIALHGRKAAAAKADDTRARIEKAKRAIEKDIEKNDGIYPHDAGNVTTAAVLRRAGLDAALLQKERHQVLRDEVTAWVKGVHEKMRRGAKVVRKAVTERADVARSEADEIRQRWVEAELEYVERRDKLAKLIERCDLLEKENARLKAAVAGENVVTIGKRGK